MRVPPSPAPHLPARLLALVLVLLIGLLPANPARAALTTNSYDGNIYALYAGNGSLVPPRSSLEQAMADHRAAVVVYYLDDSADSKQFSPVLNELQRLWGRSVELIPLTTDALQNRPDTGPTDPAHYWTGEIPQVVVFDPSGAVILEGKGQVDIDAINAALTKATGLDPTAGAGTSITRSFNELNSEVVPAG
ncbi:MULTISPECIES: thylakoid membrane photosystem I accumulation factor [Synechococcales]|uniref:thylakoid membrane photosystem I accumulation factor n=1 Tax=unclassified Synechococcus TaxID=2626047 RepID=UPI0021A6FEF3|nr:MULTISPECIES: thylakoid membrane photosystem I accumulation factor [unclassified Synechococcus]